MKTKLFLLAAATALLAGCTDELERQSSYAPEGGLQATIPAYPFDDGTRVSISNDLQTFTWSNNDQIGLYYLDGDITAHAGFGIVTGGSTTGTFTNSAFYLHPSSTYYGFYPFNESATVNEAPVDFIGQRQIESGSAAHLGAMNYMYSVVNTDTEGDAQIYFQNLGSVMVIRLIAPATDKYSSLEIRSNDAQFITKGNASMTDGTVTPTETSNSISLYLGFIGDGISMTKGDLLTFYLLTAPVDLSGKTLYFVFHKPKEGTLTPTPLPFANMTGKNMLPGRAYLYDLTNREAPYVTFGASDEQTLQMTQEVSSLEYSVAGVNGGKWTVLGTNSVTFGGSHGSVRLRGKSAVGTNLAQITFGNNTPVACSGDIRTLVDYENYDTADMSDANFIYLFKGCTQLTTPPDLPSMQLRISCYYGMFQGCTSLTYAPALPATELTESCYRNMFYGCSSLTEGPVLPATTLAESCYSSMFNSCTGLTSVPDLNATTLAPYCYYSMFASCTNLTYAQDELPAMVLAENCYAGMFNGCTKLIEAPQLKATTMAERSCFGMFQSCTALLEAPELPATTLASECYLQMFANCTNLCKAPELPATTLADACYVFMFYNCTSLETAPDLPALVLAPGCYANMFYKCTSLSYIEMLATDISAEDCLYNWVGNVSSTGTFVKNAAATWNETGVSGIPDGWTVVYTDGTPYVTFKAATSQTLQMSGEVPTLEYSLNGGAWATLGTNTVPFGGSHGDLRLRGKSATGTNGVQISFARGIPVQCRGDIRTLIDYENYATVNTSQAVFINLFNGCLQLTSAPDLPSTQLAPLCYLLMFNACQSLTAAPELPATTLAEGCYRSMFSYCSSLAAAPELPATTLAQSCYNAMFQNCTKLNYIKMMATDINAQMCLENWTSGVASTGTFVMNAGATWEVYGANGIPTGWAVQRANE